MPRYPQTHTPQGSLITALPGTAQALTPSDTADLHGGFTVFARTSGDVAVVPVDNDDATPVVFFVSDGGMVPVRVRRLMATGTTAGGFVGVR